MLRFHRQRAPKAPAGIFLLIGRSIMRTIVLLSAVGAMLAAMLPGTPAQAAPRTWVSGTGSGGACTRSSPCADFNLAYNATDPGGEINCVDAGDFAGIHLTFPQSSPIHCAGTAGTYT